MPAQIIAKYLKICDETEFERPTQTPLCGFAVAMRVILAFTEILALTKGGQIKYPTMHHFRLYYQRADAKITSF